MTVQSIVSRNRNQNHVSIVPRYSWVVSIGSRNSLTQTGVEEFLESMFILSLCNVVRWVGWYSLDYGITLKNYEKVMRDNDPKLRHEIGTFLKNKDESPQIPPSSWLLHVIPCNFMRLMIWFTEEYAVQSSSEIDEVI